MSDKDFDFSNEIDKASWELLRPHHARGAVFVVAANLDLAMVADAIAQDKVNLVKIWLDNGEFRKLEDEDIKGFKDNDHEDIVNFIIVQPYVLIQFF